MSVLRDDAGAGSSGAEQKGGFRGWGSDPALPLGSLQARVCMCVCMLLCVHRHVYDSTYVRMCVSVSLPFRPSLHPSASLSLTCSLCLPLLIFVLSQNGITCLPPFE